MYLRRHRCRSCAYADTLIPSVAFGHFLGRLGCFSAGCCWGCLATTHVPWAARFPPESGAYRRLRRRGLSDRRFFSAGRLPPRPSTRSSSTRPSASSLFLLLALWCGPASGSTAQVLASWLLLYAVLRGALETFRGDLARHAYAGLNSGQWTSVAILATGAVLWLRAPRPREAGAATV